MIAFGASQVVMPQAARFPSQHGIGLDSLTILTFGSDAVTPCAGNLPDGHLTASAAHIPRAVQASALDVGPGDGGKQSLPQPFAGEGNPLPDRGKLLQFKVSAWWEPKTLPAQGATCRLPPAMLWQQPVPKPGRGALSR